MLAIHDAADLDLTGGDVVNGDPCLPKRSEHPAGHSGVTLHAGPDRTDLGQAHLNVNVPAPQLPDQRLADGLHVRNVPMLHGECDGRGVAKLRLHDVIHADVRCGDRFKDLRLNARGSRQRLETDAPKVLLECATNNNNVFHDLLLGHNQRAQIRLLAMTNMNRNAELFAKQHGARMHDRGTHGR